jgi:hypothetical protein
MSKTIHFEIGHLKYYGHDVIGESLTETESVFHSDNLSDCLKEFVKQGYKEPEYFIDVWEQDGVENPPYPIADIKIDAWTLADYKPAERTI